MKRVVLAAAFAAALAGIGCARHRMTSTRAMADVPDACKSITPDDTFWWWWYSCDKPAAGGGAGGAG